jgi:hypothetical protein
VERNQVQCCWVVAVVRKKVSKWSWPQFNVHMFHSFQ